MKKKHFIHSVLFLGIFITLFLSISESICAFLELSLLF